METWAVKRYKKRTVAETDGGSSVQSADHEGDTNSEPLVKQIPGRGRGLGKKRKDISGSFIQVILPLVWASGAHIGTRPIKVD